jgi:hypothetical protein
LTPRQQCLGAALLGTVGLSVWLACSVDPAEPAPLAEPPVARAARPSTRLPALARPPDALTATPAAAPRPIWPEPAEAALAAWSVPAPPALPAAPKPAAAPAPPAVAAPPPVAPALRYTLVGSLQQAAGWQALLAGAQRSLAVRAGDVVDGQWRIDQVNASGLEGVWLPQGLPFSLRYPSP